VGPDPWINSFLWAVAMFTAVYFALSAWIPAALLVRWLILP
jgi:hypothetical protein